MMKLSLSLLLATVVFSLAPLAKADPIDGFVGVAYNYSKHLSDSEPGGRMGARLEFARLSRNVAIDIRANTGKNYTDIGGTFRLFHHWYFGEGGTGISLGSGVGAMYSRGYTKATVKNIDYFTDTAAKRAFVEPVINPFVRFIWDTDLDFGFSAELGYEAIPQRSFTKGNPTRDARFRNRVVFAVGVLFGA